jgi:hypothetical protein
MPTSYEDKISQQAVPYLEDGEGVLSAFIAKPRGAGVAAMGGLAGQAVGGHALKQQRGAAQEVGLRLVSPMALALTNRRLVVFSVSAPLGLGKGGDVKELVSSVPLSAVDSIERKRLLVGSVAVVTVGGTSFKLEVGAGGDVKGMAERFAQVAAAA